MLFPILIVLSTATSIAPALEEAPLPQISGPNLDQEDDQPVPPQQRVLPAANQQAGRAAESSAGIVGERVTRNAVEASAGIKPMARLTSRIQNRVQNRIRNRIDRTYNSEAATADPFAIAEDQTTGRSPH